MIKLKLVSLTLLGNRKNYSIHFKNGFNLISGPTSTGKTAILEMIDYALGSKGHKSYIEIGNSCSHVELVLYIGTEKYLIRRRLFEFKEPIIVEQWDNDKEKFLFHNRMEVDSPSNPKSLSAFLIEKMGLTDFSISGQAFSFRDVFKYCYIKQTEIDNEDILGEKSWEKNFKRKATFEILFNIYDKGLEQLKSSVEQKKDELKALTLQLQGIQDFLKSIDIENVADCGRAERTIQNEILELQRDLSSAKNQKEYKSDILTELRKRINALQCDLQKKLEEKNAQKQYLGKLQLLYNQYTSEIEKKELAIEGYLVFNRFEFKFCPNCLQPIQQGHDPNICCLCGNEASTESSEIVLLKKDITILRRKSKELLHFIEKEDLKLDEQIKEENQIRVCLHEAAVELGQLSMDYINPYIKQIEYYNYEIGRKNRLLIEIRKELQMFEQVERYQKLITGKEDAIQSIRNNIKTLTQNTIDKDDVLIQLSDAFEDALSAFQYPKLSSAYIDDKSYLPYVRGRKYDDIGSLAGVTLITIAYYLSILLVGVSEGFSHPGLLIIDSPRKNLGAQAAESENNEFKDEKIFNATMNYLCTISETYKDQVQVIVVNNGYPDIIPAECVVAEFDSDEHNGLPQGFIDDAV